MAPRPPVRRRPRALTPRTRPPRIGAARTAVAPASESLAPIHPAAGRDLADDGRGRARGRHGLPRAVGVGAAGSRLPDDRDHDALSRCESGRHDLGHHGAARAPVRPGARPAADVLDELGRRFGHHAQVHARPHARRRRAGSPGGDQRGRVVPADRPADAPILTLAVTSATLPLPAVEDYVDTRLAQKLSEVSGVGLVSIGGGQRPAVRVQINPVALAAAGLTLEDVRTALGNQNVNQAKGSFDGSIQASTLDANDQLRSADEYRKVVLAYKNGSAIRLTDVGQVIDDAENTKLAAWASINGKTTPAVILNIQRQPGSNVIQTVNRTLALLPQLQAGLPGALQVTVLADRTTTIRASVQDVEFELGLSIALVVMVIFLFLRNVRATIIPSIVVPVSLVGTFGVMYLAGFSINNLTIMALTIATGFVVDDAIVMIENISRYIEEGMPPLEAALKGSRQIGFTIISLTVSLIAVLIPLLFMREVVGRLFREFAVTLAVSIVISAIVSLTLTPMMCGRLLKIHDPAAEAPWLRRVGAAFDSLAAAYGRWLKVVLQYRRTTLWVAVGTLVLTILLYILVPKGFFPIQDTGALQGLTDAPQSISFAAMAERQQALAEALLADPAVESISSIIGVDGVNATLNSGRLQIQLKPHGERSSDLVGLMAELSQRAAKVTGITLYLQPIQDLTIEDRVSRTQYQFTLEDADGAELSTQVNRLVERLKTVDGLTDVASDLQ